MMRNVLVVLLFQLPTFAIAVLTPHYLTIVNAASDRLVAFEVASAGKSSFQNVEVGNRHLQGGGDSTTIAVGEDGSGCLRDLFVSFTNGRVLVQRHFDIRIYGSYHTNHKSGEQA